MKKLEQSSDVLPVAAQSLPIDITYPPMMMIPIPQQTRFSCWTLGTATGFVSALVN